MVLLFGTTNNVDKRIYNTNEDLVELQKLKKKCNVLKIKRLKKEHWGNKDFPFRTKH